MLLGQLIAPSVDLDYLLSSLHDLKVEFVWMENLAEEVDIHKVIHNV